MHACFVLSCNIHVHNSSGYYNLHACSAYFLKIAHAISLLGINDYVLSHFTGLRCEPRGGGEED